jgi:hypothetical protein
LGDYVEDNKINWNNWSLHDQARTLSCRDWIYAPRIPWKRIVSEAVKKVKWIEVMKLHSIEAVLDPENYGSARVLEKMAL